MENQKLIEIREKLIIMPVLQERLVKLEQRILEAEKEKQELLCQYNEESLDVEQMKKDSFSNTLFKLFKRYEGKLDKETIEMINAKLEYDKASGRVTRLYAERDELNIRISSILENKQAYEAELKNREEAIKSSMSSEAYGKYEQLENERKALCKQMVEITEAISAAHRVKSTADSAMQHLESAEDWAAFDIWTRGGIISHMVKYDHIDSAEENFNDLSSQISDLNKELADVNILVNIEGIGIDSSTRMFDFWFDNIFTDLSVRDKLRADQEELAELKLRINEVIDKLNKNSLQIHSKLEDVDHRKNDLLISAGEI